MISRLLLTLLSLAATVEDVSSLIDAHVTTAPQEVAAGNDDGFRHSCDGIKADRIKDV